MMSDSSNSDDGASSSRSDNAIVGNTSEVQTSGTFLKGDNSNVTISQATINITSKTETANVSGAKRKQNKRSKEEKNIPEDYVKISGDTYMYTKEPIKQGANVFKGFQLHVTGQKTFVAIKKIMPCNEKSKREVEHLVNLSRNSPHPNVVRIMRSKVHTELTHDVLYIVMELCKKTTLHDYLKENHEKNRPLNKKQAVSFAKQLISAMKHIHVNGIIHGDLKPENILLSLDGEQIKVSDFGISKQLRDGRLVTKITGLGTDGYRAPETYTSNEISKSADIYSLGIILFAIFTNGLHPHGGDPDLWAYNIKKGLGLDMSPLPMGMGSLRKGLIDLLERIFVLDPKRRPTIDELSCQFIRVSASRVVEEEISHHLEKEEVQETSKQKSSSPMSDATMDIVSGPSMEFAERRLLCETEKFEKVRLPLQADQKRLTHLPALGLNRTVRMSSLPRLTLCFPEPILEQ